MPTIGANVKLTLSTDKTRSDLESFYRGIVTPSITQRPIVELVGEGTHEYDISESSFLIFVSDYFEGANPFTLDITTSDSEGIETIASYTGVGFLILEASNLVRVAVKNTLIDTLYYRIFY